MSGSLPPSATQAFSTAVRHRFARGAAAYEDRARLQRAVAWRMARLCRDLPVPPGPRADLGAGSGLLSRALAHHCPFLADDVPLQLDLCPELLGRNPLLTRAPQRGRRWDLNRGLPADLDGAAFLASSFALQWLDEPGRQLAHWCGRLRRGGWLALALPTAGSFGEWRRAAAAAGVPCTALDLPPAATLIAAAAALELERPRRLRFTFPHQGGLRALRQLRELGADASRHPPLDRARLRRLLLHWPEQTPFSWEILMLIGRRR
jgi:malonyl-CoA O-methyltransferase